MSVTSKPVTNDPGYDAICFWRGSVPCAEATFPIVFTCLSSISTCFENNYDNLECFHTSMIHFHLDRKYPIEIDYNS